MQITQLPEKYLAVIESNDALQRYLANLERGKPFTRRSWLYEDVEPDQILQNWLSVLDKLKLGDNAEIAVYQFDTSQLKKWGPQGGVKPIKDILEEIVVPTFKADPNSFKAHHHSTWLRSIDKVRSDVLTYVRGLRPASYTNVVADMRARDTLESNSGWPMFARRNIPSVLAAAIDAAQTGEYESYPAIALFRNYNLKTRLVWMFPESTNIVEGSFCQPIQSAMINSVLGEGFYCPWRGFEHVRSLLTSAYERGYVLMATDFSKTDEHFTLSATEQVLEVLEYLVQGPYRGALGHSLRHMHNIPLIVGPNKIIFGLHGVASGSTWTNFVETVFDNIFAYFVDYQTDSLCLPLCAIGDDMCWLVRHYKEELPKEMEQLGAIVGQELNAEKVSNEPDQVKFLQRLFIRGYKRQDGQLRGVYSTVRALKASVYPERFHKPSTWNSNMFCARQYMILENCVDHPLFEDFVKFVVKGQRDLIPFAKKDAKELAKITRETKLIPGFNPTYNQEKRDLALSEFASIRLARTL